MQYWTSCSPAGKSWGNVLIQGSSGCSDCEMVELEFLSTVRRAHHKLIALEFRRADYGFSKDLLGRVPWDRGLEGRGLVELQKSSPPSSGAMHTNKEEIRQNGRKPPWMDKELLCKLRGKREAYRNWT